jgi:hypothetical protein
VLLGVVVAAVVEEKEGASGAAGSSPSAASSSSSPSSSSSSSIYDSAELVIQELIDECQRNIDDDEQYKNNNSLAANEYLKQKIKTLQNAPRDLKKLERLLKTKEKECGKARYAVDIESLVAEIEVLRVIRYLMNRNDYNSTSYSDNRRRTYLQRSSDLS